MLAKENISPLNQFVDFIKETIKLKEIFQFNGYSKYLVNKVIEEFLKQEATTSKNFKRKIAINKKQNDLEIKYFKKVLF